MDGNVRRRTVPCQAACRSQTAFRCLSAGAYHSQRAFRRLLAGIHLIARGLLAPVCCLVQGQPPSAFVRRSPDRCLIQGQPPSAFVSSSPDHNGLTTQGATLYKYGSFRKWSHTMSHCVCGCLTDKSTGCGSHSASLYNQA